MSNPVWMMVMKDCGFHFATFQKNKIKTIYFTQLGHHISLHSPGDALFKCNMLRFYVLSFQSGPLQNYIILFLSF